MAWEHDPVIEKKKTRFLSLFLILMVKFPPLHVILIMRRYWSLWTLTWERRLLLKAGSGENWRLPNYVPKHLSPLVMFKLLFFVKFS